MIVLENEICEQRCSVLAQLNNAIFNEALHKFYVSMLYGMVLISKG